eukprot:3198143-Rhodomonas_salina.1
MTQRSRTQHRACSDGKEEIARSKRRHDRGQHTASRKQQQQQQQQQQQHQQQRQRQRQRQRHHAARCSLQQTHHDHTPKKKKKKKQQRKNSSGKTASSHNNKSTQHKTRQDKTGQEHKRACSIQNRGIADHRLICLIAAQHQAHNNSTHLSHNTRQTPRSSRSSRPPLADRMRRLPRRLPLRHTSACWTYLLAHPPSLSPSVTCGTCIA